MLKDIVLTYFDKIVLARFGAAMHKNGHNGQWTVALVFCVRVSNRFLSP